MEKTMIAYMTSGGVTKEYAEIIAKILHEKYEHHVDLIDIRKNKTPDASTYQNIVIGTGVRAQRVYKKGLNFMKNNFDDKKVAIYISSNEAGTPDSYQDAVKKYMNPIKENNPHLNIVAIEGFGGQIKVFGKTAIDLREPDRAARWAETIGELFKN